MSVIVHAKQLRAQSCHETHNRWLYHMQQILRETKHGHVMPVHSKQLELCCAVMCVVQITAAGVYTSHRSQNCKVMTGVLLVTKPGAASWEAGK